MRKLIAIWILLVSVGSPAQTSPVVRSGRHTNPQFDGTWWLSANAGERAGFLNGVADCMTWEAHKKGYSATPEQLVNRITKFYQTNPKSRNLSILAAWQRVSATAKQVPAPKGGETWNNPHWYLNGDWWAQIAQTEQLGFVEGYLWCVRTQVDEPHASFSKSDDFYWEKVNSFVTANPKLGKEAVATTLSRFQDKPKSKKSASPSGCFVQ